MDIEYTTKEYKKKMYEYIEERLRGTVYTIYRPYGDERRIGKKFISHEYKKTFFNRIKTVEVRKIKTVCHIEIQNYKYTIHTEKFFFFAFLKAIIEDFEKIHERKDRRIIKVKIYEEYDYKDYILPEVIRNAPYC